jgi:hypothetical protein
MVAYHLPGQLELDFSPKPAAPAAKSKRAPRAKASPKAAAARADAAADERTCLRCFCTAASPCPGGCSWVKGAKANGQPVDLCSACKVKEPKRKPAAKSFPCLIVGCKTRNAVEGELCAEHDELALVLGLPEDLADYTLDDFDQLAAGRAEVQTSVAERSKCLVPRCGSGAAAGLCGPHRAHAGTLGLSPQPETGEWSMADLEQISAHVEHLLTDGLTQAATQVSVQLAARPEDAP